MESEGIRSSSVQRIASLDGLRGILAMSVFIHHAYVWRIYLQSGSWSAPDSHLFNQLGQTGVAFFFMISSYLFVKKLLDFKGERFNWKSFYIQRFFRLAPLHFVLVALIILIVFVQSDWQLKTSVYELFSSSAKWFGFGTIGFAEINGMDASMINSSVLWSLSYEWALYLSLPILAIFLTRSKPNFFFISFGLLFISFTLLYRSYEIQHLLSFLGGAIAPFIQKFRKAPLPVNSIWFTLLLAGLLGSILFFHSPENLICKLLLALSFTLIALGNDFFGLLNSRALRFLGDISYGIYLMHGILIYFTVHFVLGFDNAADLGTLDYCLLIFGIAVVLIILSYLAHRFIEKPAMRISRREKK